jgi:5-methylcytosine-specific restriction endonuclease McrA
MKLLALAAAAVAGALSINAARAFDTLPNPSLTPGFVTNMSVEQICKTTWGADARYVTDSMKDDVRDAYNFDVRGCPLTMFKGKHIRRAEIDHLVPRSLGGADDTRNLWPQCYEVVNKQDKSRQQDGAHKKDRLETELHKRLCKSPSQETLYRYQNGFKNNWLTLYHETYPDEGAAVATVTGNR